MEHPPAVTMEAVRPELASQWRLFEVVMTVPRSDGGEPLVPFTLSAGVLTCWSADEIIVSATVLAGRPSTALAAAEALMPELPEAAKVLITVQPTPGPII
jgi:hypothetical protein